MQTTAADSRVFPATVQGNAQPHLLIVDCGEGKGEDVKEAYVSRNGSIPTTINIVDYNFSKNEWRLADSSGPVAVANELHMVLQMPVPDAVVFNISGRMERDTSPKSKDPVVQALRYFISCGSRIIINDTAHGPADQSRWYEPLLSPEDSVIRAGTADADILLFNTIDHSMKKRGQTAAAR